MNITIDGHKCTSLEEIKSFASEDVSEFIQEFYNGKEYIEAHTSGSTGEPKLIHLFKSDMKESAKLTNDFFGLNEYSVFYLNLSPSYIAGKMMLVRALELGASIFTEKPSNEPLSKYDSNEHISLGAFVPSQVSYLINHPEKLQLIDNIIIGGGQLSERVERWLAEKGVKAYKTYGMTETCSHVALAKVGVNGNPYTALGTITFEKDDRGCLIINHQGLLQKRFFTNDVVDLISEKEFCWQGRIDNVINTGGIKVFPEEVEPKIAGILRKARFFITSAPSEKWGQELLLAIEYSGLQEGEKKEGLISPNTIEKMKAILPEYSVPKKYIAVKKFKYTTSGKIIRKI